ncbi:MAG: CDP-alcohol phosphatidyltransferase family protein [Elusimicrobia bacterium]|nr:CDP-alcohol phosphatidyltransferase family protein [Elusimicrobiota bacterium]
MRLLPNHLTILRLVMAPIFALLIIEEKPWCLALASLIAVFAFVSDLLDGYLARLWNKVSDFGICFDPIVDKAFILSAFAALIVNPSLALSCLPFVFIIIRELLVSGLRVVLLSGRQGLLAAERFGKLKAGLQFGLIMILSAALWLASLDIIRIESGFIFWGRSRFISLGILFWAVGIFTLISGLPYFWHNRRALFACWNTKSART